MTSLINCEICLTCSYSGISQIGLQEIESHLLKFGTVVCDRAIFIEVERYFKIVALDFFADVCYNRVSTLKTKGGFSMSRYYRSNSYERMQVVGVILLFVVCIAIAVARPINKISDIRTIEGTVTEKTTKRKGDDDKYLVFIADESGNVNTLEITDSLLKWRFNSSDVYAGIEEGKTYSFEVGGSRLPILSWYPNIYSYTEIE